MEQGAPKGTPCSILFLGLCRCNSWNDTWPSRSLCHECSTEVCAEVVRKLCYRPLNRWPLLLLFRAT